MFGLVCIISCLYLAQGKEIAPEEISKTDSEPSCPCGNNEKSLNTRVVGGHSVGRNYFPYASNLMMRNHRSDDFPFERTSPLHPFCGGTLITDRHILTAAHCIKKRQAEDLTADVGDYSLAIAEDRLLVNLKNVTLHPDYEIGKFFADIAILELEESVMLYSDLKMAILPNPDLDLPPATTVTVYGWGRLDYEGGSAEELQAVDLPVMGNEECGEQFTTHIESNMLCAGGEPGKDACIGDSGSGLVARFNNDYVLVGVVSFGRSCALPHVPGVYTRVSNFTNWILEHTESAACKPCVYEGTLSQ